MDFLKQSALAWKELTEYRYQLVYGYKKLCIQLISRFHMKTFHIWLFFNT